MPLGPCSRERRLQFPSTPHALPTDSGASPAWPPCRAARQANNDQLYKVLSTGASPAEPANHIRALTAECVRFLATADIRRRTRQQVERCP